MLLNDKAHKETYRRPLAKRRSSHKTPRLSDSWNLHILTHYDRIIVSILISRTYDFCYSRIEKYRKHLLHCFCSLTFIALFALLLPGTLFAQTSFGNSPMAAPRTTDTKEEEEPLPPPPLSYSEVKLPKGEAAREGDIIDEVRVTGVRRVDPESILAQLNTSAKKAINRIRISDDIKRVYRLGYFSDIQVDATRTPDGKNIVTFIVTEKPAIARINIIGNDAISDDDIKKVVNLKRNSILNEVDVKENVENIRNLYLEKGFFLTEVESKLTTPPDRDDLVVVDLKVQEFPKPQIKSVTFIGNHHIPSSELRDQIATRIADWSSLISSPTGQFNEQNLEQDIQRLYFYYGNKGYINANIETPSVRLSPDKRYFHVTIKVDEGDKFSFNQVNFQGDILTSKEDLYNLIDADDKAKSDDPTFDYMTLRTDTEKIKNLYADAGYAYVTVNPLIPPNQTNKTVDLTYDIRKGDKVHFGRIEIVGNNKTRDKVIRRELRIEEGDLYSNTKLEESRRRVLRLGFFDNVTITTQRTNRSDVIDAIVEIKERPTGNFQIGAGFSSTENFMFNAQVTQNNLFGRGQLLGLQAQLSSLRKLFNVSFFEPYFLDTDIRLTLNIYNYDNVYTDYARTSRGGRATFGYPILRSVFDDLLTASVSYKLEHASVRTSGQSNRLTNQVGNLFRGGLTSSITLALSYDDRNDRQFPTDGSYHYASVEIADNLVTGSQVEFVKYDFDTRWYIPLPLWKFVLRLRGQIGYVHTLNPLQPVPLFERYLVGSPETVRGFERYTLGPFRRVPSSPKDPGSALNNYVIGGNKQLLITAEIEFPILEMAGLKGVVFLDAGNTFGEDRFYSFIPDFALSDKNDYADALRTSAGFGIRWFSPIGPLRFEWGFPLKPLRHEKPVIFDFSMGGSF